MGARRDRRGDAVAPAGRAVAPCQGRAMPWKGHGTSPSPTGSIRTPVESRRRLSALAGRWPGPRWPGPLHAQPAVPEGLTIAPVARTTDELLASWTAVADCYREHDSNEVAGAMPWEEDA